MFVAELTDALWVLAATWKLSLTTNDATGAPVRLTSAGVGNISFAFTACALPPGLMILVIETLPGATTLVPWRLSPNCLNQAPAPVTVYVRLIVNWFVPATRHNPCRQEKALGVLHFGKVP